MSNVANIVGNIVSDSGVAIDSKASLGAVNDFSPAVSAAAGLAYAIKVAPILTATGNSDNLVGLDINPAYANGAFTGVNNYALRVTGNTTLNGNLMVGTGVDSGYKLDVNGTSRFSGTVTLSSGSGERSFQSVNALGYVTAIGTVSTGLTTGSTTALGIRLSNPGYGGFYTYGTMYPGMYYGLTGGERIVINSHDSLGLYAYGTARTIIKMHDSIELIMSTVADTGIVWGTNSSGSISAQGKIHNTGNVHIGGTTDPGNKLYVTGAGYFTGDASNNAIYIPSGKRIFTYNRSVAIGEDVSAGYEAVGIGWNVNSANGGNILIGKSLSGGIYTNVIMLANNDSGTLTATSSGTLNIGSSNTSGVAIFGATSGAGTNREIAIYGTTSGAGIEGNIAIGRDASASGALAIALGAFSQASASEFVAGSRDKPISNVYFGGGNQSTSRGIGTGTAYTINGSGAFGTDFAGGNITIAGGKGTGTGTPGDVIISTATTTSTGTTLQTLTQRVWIKGENGNVGIGASPSATYKLDVNGTGRFTGNVTLSGDGTGGTDAQIAFSVNTTSGSSRNFITSNAFSVIARTYSYSTINTHRSNGVLFTNDFNSNGIEINSPSASSYSIKIGSDKAAQILYTDDSYFQIVTQLRGYSNTNGLPIVVQAADGYDQFGSTSSKRGGDLYLRAGSVQGAIADTALNQGNVYINDTQGNSVIIGSTSNIQSAILQVSSTTKGFLPPRMTSTQRTAISSPAVGLIVYQTNGTEGLYENTSTGWRIINAAGGGSGTVTTVSVASANGFAGTVANATTTPEITISTTVTGLLKGNGTAISAATAGTDYLTPSDVAYSITSVSTTHTETATKGTKIIKADTTSGAFTINLPTAVSNTATIIIKKVAGSGALTIDGNGTETIDGGTTATINKVYESITLISDNTNWQIV